MSGPEDGDMIARMPGNDSRDDLSDSEKSNARRIIGEVDVFLDIEDRTTPGFKRGIQNKAGLKNNLRFLNNKRLYDILKRASNTMKSQKLLHDEAAEAVAAGDILRGKNAL